ncbi:MAG: Ni/Fe hydrogenase subunit alpha [Nanoarchaeota archaeon]
MAKTITLNHITKIEGHASLTIGIDAGEVTRCELGAVEGARYFEGMVVGRKFNEAHEITSRICGICSCAHVIAAIKAVEDALGYQPSEQTVALRKLLTLGERIRSHATHLYFLALPDYLGYESALAMAKKYKPQLQQALNLMKAGNSVLKTLAARDLHPVSATPGGWLKLPSQEQLDGMRKELLAVKEDSLATCELFFSLDYKTFESQGEWFSLSDKREYAMLDGVLASPSHRFTRHQYREFIKEYHEPYSTANFVVKKDHRYMVSALARLNNNSAQLSNSARQQLHAAKLRLPSANPFHNTLAQAIETVHCIDHAVDLIGSLRIREEKLEKLTMKRGIGVGAIEVPRGTLWHEYTLDGNGVIRKANIITPTAQNMLNIQEDIREFIPELLDLKQQEIILEIEKLIRSYDPCFSCSAHFLEVKWI